MTALIPRPAVTFGVHATSHGFGWAAFEGPFTLHDWGTCRAHTNKNDMSMRRFEKLIERLKPDRRSMLFISKMNQDCIYKFLWQWVRLCVRRIFSSRPMIKMRQALKNIHPVPW